MPSRRTALKAAGLVVLPVWLAALGACSGGGVGEEARGELGRRLAGVDDPDRFVVDYSATGTEVLDCFLPNRHFSVAVDRTSGVLVVSADGDVASPLAVLVGDDVFLSADLFSDGAVDGMWLRAPADVGGEAVAAIERALGGGMAGFLFAGGLPPNGRETAEASLEVAADVTSLRPQEVNNGGLDGFGMRLDPERLDEEAAGSGSGSLASGREIGGPRVVVWLDGDDRVARIVVTAAAPHGSEGSASEGWAVDYRVLTQPLDASAPTDAVDVDEVDPTKLRAPAQTTCELGAANR